MEESLLLQELEALAAELAVDVRYEDLDSRGGLCRFGGRTCLLLSRDLSVPERVDLFAEGLAGLPLEGVFMRPRVRELLERRASKADVRSG
ncbi:hypothetical protein ACFL6X_05230 [Candidatus Latescibacterota bacterium]